MHCSCGEPLSAIELVYETGCGEEETDVWTVCKSCDCIDIREVFQRKVLNA